MSHGLPDYYRGVDIAYQALSELINRPKYGGAQRTAGSVAVTANDTTQLISVSAKGMIYGGYLFLDHTATQKNSIFILKVDGNIIGYLSADGGNAYNINIEHNSPVYLRKYDDTNFIYCMALSHGITFETSFTVEYEEKHGGTPTLSYRVVYAVV